ncbi:MAG TPA: hypothetical protein PKC85_10535 [Bacteroidia bacterium]|jgi:hypothetical protein|nr:hypothetical protein [Bacteroidia bacterium]HMU20267.1 hypothetical protein [Bacteroidia bacterium]
MKSIKFKKYKNNNLFKEALEFATIGNRGVQLATIDSQKRKIPTVFGIMGKVFYKLSDGTITTKSPFKKRKKQTTFITFVNGYYHN